MKSLAFAALLCAWAVRPLMATQTNTAFESLGIPVRVGGLMGCIVGPNGRGGEALYYNLDQTGGHLLLVQVDPDTGGRLADTSRFSTS